jgi:predicted alpha/beta-hydrolase family hydrolase
MSAWAERLGALGEVVRFDYPYMRAGRRSPDRLPVPILFVQGTRDPLCPLDALEDVRARMCASSALHPVVGGNHSLAVGARDLRAAGETQEEVDARTLRAIVAFLREHLHLQPEART